MSMAPATKTSQKRLEASVNTFHARYASSDQWGPDRWHESLYPALARPTTYCALVNQYAINPDKCRDLLGDSAGVHLMSIDLLNLSGEEEEEFPGDSTVRENASSSNSSNSIVCFGRVTVETAAESVRPFTFPPPTTVSSPSSTNNRLLTHWNMDAASVLAARMLDVRPGDQVLDMCAAPGGKSIVLAQSLFPDLHETRSAILYTPEILQRSSITINEFDATRYKRLVTNMKAYLPSSLFPTPEKPKAPVKIINNDLSGKNGVTMLPNGVGGYDKVLIDAPCSSERHIIHAYEKAKAAGRVAEEMLNWKSSHVASLVKVQAGLLYTALMAVRVGGRIVYATCAIGKEENDGVVERVLKGIKEERKRAKRDGKMVYNWDIQYLTGTEARSICSSNNMLDAVSENTQFGRIALPDKGGWGPLFFSVMIKVQRTKQSLQTSKHDNCNVEVQPAVQIANGDTIEAGKSNKNALDPQVH